MQENVLSVFSEIHSFTPVHSAFSLVRTTSAAWAAVSFRYLEISNTRTITISRSRNEFRRMR